MKNKKVDLTKEFNKIAKECGSLLLKKNDIIQITYPLFKGSAKERMKQARAANKGSISQLLDGGVNIYALWVAKTKGNWKLQYIGQRKENSIRERLCQHLFSKHERTGSKLKNVKRELSKKYKIGVSVIRVVPDEMRSSVEESLIKKNLPSWNIQSKQ